ncbi:MAG: hypothetical protein CFE29_02990 [Bradyrhizobiaceae bacterium PARB1]|jgi:peptidoglycan/LPS O-acetylase OafA/YrhL|nr:MAG: hypothetical protein CFE29_02990 [Bradyrhizobiaceae bacterium PARB1]
MERRQFYPNLEVARGIAALMVALFHAGQMTYLADGAARSLIPSIRDPFTWPAQIARVFANGPGAVIFFFALSGFVLTMVLEQSKGSRASISLRFAVGRIFRIYPAVVSTLALFFIAYLVSGRSLATPSEFEPVRLALNALLLIKSIDGVMWSLQVEMAAVPLLLAVYFGWQRLGFAAIFWPYIVLLGLSFVGTWNHLFGDPGQFGQIYAFLAGMTVYLYGQRYVATLARPWLWTLAAVIAFLATRHIVGWSSYFTYWFEATFASAIVALLAFGVQASASAAWYRALQFIGRVSFSFYLLHPITMAFGADLSPALSYLVNAGLHPLGVAALLLIGSTALILPIAWVQYRLVELPMVSAGKAMLARRNRSAAVTA